MAWYLAPSLAQLRHELNTRWPGRDRASDGSIGDAAHKLSRSDHNPNSRGSVNAIDVDEDGLRFATVFAAIKQHPSARYVIYERRLYHRDRGWRAEPYSGTNPHDKHFHLSIDQTERAENDTRSWGLINTTGGIMLPKFGDSGPEVRYWQRILIAAGEKLPRYGTDGDYGNEMKAAVKSWYVRNGGDPAAFDGSRVTDWTAFSLQRKVFAGAKGDPGAAGKDGQDGVLQLPATVEITGRVTSFSVDA